MLKCSPASLSVPGGPDARGGSRRRAIGAAAEDEIDVAAVGGLHDPIPALSDKSLGTWAASWFDSVTSRVVDVDDAAALTAGDDGTAGRSLPNNRFDTSSKFASSML